MPESYVREVPLPQYELWERAGKKRSPLSCIHEVTARCNNDCRHCYLNLPADDATARERELSLEEICGIADQAVAMGTLWWVLTGGEPLLRYDFVDLYRALKQRGFLITLFTNACLISDEHVRLFAALPPRKVEVTVYSASEATYERVTGKPGSYAAFRRGLERLQRGHIAVNLKAMIIRSNMHELSTIADFCQTHSAAPFRYDPMLHLRYDGDPRRNDMIRSERLTAEEILAIERADPKRFSAMQQECQSETIVPSTEHPHIFRCAAGVYDYCLGADGGFRLCSSLCHPDCVVDLRTSTLAAAWDTLVPAVRARESFAPDFLDTCHACPSARLCMWCPAHAHLEHGRLDACVPYFCEVAHARRAAVVMA